MFRETPGSLPGGSSRLRFGFHFGVLAAEALDATRCIDQLLLAGKERVAVGADFRVDVVFVRGARGEVVATCANHSNFVIVRMNSLLRHDSSL